MRFVPPLLASLALAGMLAAPASARTWKQEWTVGQHPVVQVTTNDAHVSIHRGAPGHVSASVDYMVTVWGLHSRVQDPIIEFTHKGEDLVIVNVRSRSNAVFFGGMTERFHVDVTLPASCDVQVRSGDGGVEIEPIAGTIDLQTGDGHITAHGASGRLRMWTGDGGIDADGLDGALVAHSGDGHVKIAGRFDVLELSSGDGRIEASVAHGSSLLQPWSVRTGDGGVTLRIPRDLKALVDATSSDGSVVVDLPITGLQRSSHRVLSGQLNGGSMPLHIHTGDGSVTLALSE